MGLLDSLFGQKPVQAQTSMSQPQSRGLLGNLSDPAIALPIAGALMQPGGFGQNLGQGFAMAGQGMEARRKLQREELQQNATAKWLEAQGADTGLVELAKSGGGAQALQLYQAGKKDPMNELNLQKTQLEINNLKNGGGGKFYGNVQYGKDANGKDIAFQVGESGRVKQLELPAGATLAPPGLQKVDMGTSWAFVDRAGDVIGTQPKDVAGEASQTAIGKGRGEAMVAYNSMASKMPGLETVIKKLDDLSDKATYTLTGQLYNAGRRQIGMDPSEGAKARTEYISTVDNQVLPLLRETFGAAFTQKEGDTLRATLGDPDKSPQEKQLVLKSFIEQKRRDVEALAHQASSTTIPAPQGGGASDPLGIR